MLTVTGTIGIDTIYTPDGTHRENILGGSCTYFAAAASFYAPVAIVAAVGEDFPKPFRDTIARFPNINTSGLETRAGSKTFRWGGKYQTDMDHRDTLFTDLNILLEHPPLVPEPLRRSPFVFLANMHPALQRSLLESFHSPALAVADTMDLWINSARPDLERLLASVHGLVLNYDEAELFTGVRNPVAAGRRILVRGPRFVIIKKGEHGAILVHRDAIAALPAYPAETVVDPTGAGDSFAGGLMGSLAASNARDPADFDTLRRAMVHAAVVASYTIEAFSLDRLATLTRAELDARTRDYLRMLRVD